MDKHAIADLLERSYAQYISFIEETDDNFWNYAPTGKWTTGQHTHHLLQSTKPLNFALSLPKVVLSWKYGTSNREPRPYEQIKQRYKERLADSQGKVYKGSQNMEVPAISEKEYLLSRLQVQSKKLEYKTVNLSDKVLNTFILPHPLMGKMPIKEIIMWSAHHVDHHLESIHEYHRRYTNAL